MIDSLFLWIFAFLMILLLWWAVSYKGKERAEKRYAPKHERPSRGEFSGQMETDLRLTYKRFKELYPFSTITYQEYKKLQAEKAYKRTVRSEKIKRMVR